MCASRFAHAFLVNNRRDSQLPCAAGRGLVKSIVMIANKLVTMVTMMIMISNKGRAAASIMILV